ncbi:MAG: aminodeoxychorismate synthase component I [Parvularculales bacterium]
MSAGFSPLSLKCGGLIAELPFADPLTLFAPFADQPFALLLESARAHDPQGGRWSFILTAPRSRIIVPAGESHSRRPFDSLRAMCAPDPHMIEFAAAITQTFKERLNTPPPPFVGGVAGLFGYELGHALERLPIVEGGVSTPDMAVGFYTRVIAFDHKTYRAFLLSADGNSDDADFLQAQPEASPTINPQVHNADVFAVPDCMNSNFTRTDYENAIARIIEHIRAGDIFQANLSQRFETPLMPDDTPLAVYARLRRISPAPFAGFFNLGEVSILSSSPERFVSCRDGVVETRPIKGTRPRGKTPAQDKALAEELKTNSKDRAENIMIVDLLRNDLSKVCTNYSVKTEKLCAHEAYPSVHHLVSTISGRLRSGLGPVDLLTACFPGGSITGAPKIRAMEIITSSENSRRGAYCGALGYIGVDGTMDTNIAIRTITIEGQRAFFQAGGGITAASDPTAEYEETLVKAAPMAQALTLPSTHEE